MPTGVAIRDARTQLFDAAERILLREGPSGLTSRAVTGEAGVAKGVLHRHFSDFDGFLAELVEDRILRIEARGVALLEAAGSATVAENLSEALTTVFETVAVAIVSLITFRDDLQTRLRARRPGGVPMLAEASTVVAAYLSAERETGRLSAAADIDTLAPTLIGAAHLLFADRTAARPEPEAVRRVVLTVITGALTA
ncbi:TetR/AcrR family transcriptional regulator [Nocardia sp. NBC_00511]|uniref:TetR/AcrR family transcriptional regulator n=1 Tax=Nocardia sp. NBC_00511 TaxID=2903591 RepID=UPI0030E36921